MQNIPELYFKKDIEWRAWLQNNHASTSAVYLIFYKVSSEEPSMRWEEAVKVALCFGWIDSTVKKIDDIKRKQYFCPRKPKSIWSKLNKSYVLDLIKNQEMHASGLLKIEAAKKDGSWTLLNDVENLVIPTDLHTEFTKNPTAFENYQKFSPSYKKNYLYWLFIAKREVTRNKRITEIIHLCNQNIKSRGDW